MGPRPQRRAARSGPFPRTEDNPEFHFRVFVQAKLRVHRSSGFIAAAIGVAKKSTKISTGVLYGVFMVVNVV